MFSYIQTSLFFRTSPTRFFSSFTTTASSSTPSQAHLRTMAVKDLVEKAIAENKIAIFAKSWCPYCKRAKSLLKEEYDAQTIVYELDEREDGAAIQNYLLEKTGQRTVPNIFIGQAHVGGYDATLAKHRRGEIAPLLK